MECSAKDVFTAPRKKIDSVIPANAYRDVGGRATQEAKAEAESRKVI